MSKEKKPSRPRELPPPGMKRNPYFMFPYAAIEVALKSKLTAGALRCLLNALRADRGNYKVLQLGISRSKTGSNSSRNAVIKGLDQLVACGLLIEVNNHGDYRLGRMFDQFIPDDAASNDVVTDDELPAHSDSNSYAEKMLVIWNEHVDEHQKQTELDDIGRERAEDWAMKREVAGSDPIADFKMALTYFIEHGHEVPLPDQDKRRVPGKYPFKGFLKIVDIFMIEAITAKSTPSDLIVFSNNKEARATQESSVDEAPVGTDSVHPDFNQEFESFIIGGDQDGNLVYRRSKMTSVDELLLVFKYAFESVGVVVDQRRPAFKNKCVELYGTILADRSPDQVIRMVKYAYSMSKTEKQEQYFSKHPFNFFTAESLYADALTYILQADKEFAEIEEKNHREIETGVRLKEYVTDIATKLGYIAAYARLGRGWVGTENVISIQETAKNIVRDYGQSALQNLPSVIVDGLRCLTTLEIIEMPKVFSEIVGSGPWPLTYDWIRDEKIKIEFMEKWGPNKAGEVVSQAKDSFESPNTEAILDDTFKSTINDLKDSKNQKPDAGGIPRLIFPHGHNMTNSNPHPDDEDDGPEAI